MENTQAKEEDKVIKLVNIIENIYALEMTWRLNNFVLRAQSEEQGVKLMNEYKELFKQLSDSERERYYSYRYLPHLGVV